MHKKYKNRKTQPVHKPTTVHVQKKKKTKSLVYLATSFTCVADMPHRRRLRSASTEQLDVPTCRRSTVGGRAFPVAAAKVWNSLPSDVTSASSLSVFKNRLVPPLLRNWLSITFPFPSHYLPPQNSGPCNSFYCLGHFKNVYDDDDSGRKAPVCHWHQTKMQRTCCRQQATCQSIDR